MAVELPLQLPGASIYSLEGPDGAGKSTQAKRVAARLVEHGHDAISVACPSETTLGQFLRAKLTTLLPYERHTLFFLDMARTVLENQGNPKRVLVADRWTDSNLVSNRDSTPEESARWIASIPRSRKTFLLDIDPAVVLASRSESAHDHSTDVSWQQMKRERYLKLASGEKERFVVLDATLEREVITAKIVAVILSDLHSV